MGAEHIITRNKQPIYILCDPDSGDVVYVGSTFNIKNRLNAHISNANRFLKNREQGTDITKWIAVLIKSEKVPICKIIDFTRYWVVREIWWIKQFEAIGFELKNTRKNAYLSKNYLSFNG